MTILTKADRCDACPAEAKQIAVLPGLGEFLFCDHHLKKHLAVLEERYNAVVLDDRSPEDTQEIDQAELAKLLESPAKEAFYPNVPGLFGSPWFEVAPGRYTCGLNRADAEDRYKRSGASSGREILESQFPKGTWKPEQSARMPAPRVFYAPDHPMPFFEVESDKFVYARDQADASVRFQNGATSFTAKALRAMHPQGHFEGPK